MSWWESDVALTHEHYDPGSIAGGMAACERLLARPDLPWPIEQRVRMNQTWYLEPLAATGSAAFRDPPYERTQRFAGTAFNPSIARNPTGETRIILRTANYRIGEDGRYVMPDGEHVIRTRNLFCDVLGDDPHECVPITETEAIQHTARDYLVQGFEDARLFWSLGRWMFSATVRDRHPHGMCQIALCSLDDEGTITDMELMSDGQRHEKNWMPIDDDGKAPMWLYQVSPIMLHGIGRGGLWRPGLHILRNVRGGTQVIRWGEEWLCLVHEAVDFETRPHRVYLHRFVEFAADFSRVTRYSAPFCFHKRGIEFAAGMIEDGEDFLISYGVGDAKAMLLRVPIAEIDAMLGEPADEAL